MSQKELTFVVHGVHLKGGQERSSLEVLKRLAKKKWKIHLISFRLEDWPEDLPIHWIKVPDFPFKMHLLKNFYFSLVSMILILFNSKGPVVTIGSSSWVADVRIIQFVHSAYYKLIQKGLAPYPNEKTWLHKLYQWLFLNQCVLLEKVLYPHTKHLIAISNKVRNSLEEVRKNTPCTVVHHAPDSIFTVKKSNKNPEIKKILFVGALERKGIDFSLRVLSMLNSHDWVFDVVGDGDLNKWVELTKELNISEKVRFHGVTPSAPFFAEADIFLFPSTYEPFGLVVSEAISHGCAVLASNECGAMELWQNRESWLNLSVNDSKQAWANSLDKLLQDPSLVGSVVAMSTDSFTSHNWDMASDQYAAIFSEHLEPK